MFLKATPKELVKKRRLRDLILLILRSLIFALLAIAFSRPFIPDEKIRILTNQENKSVILAIDKSYSMSYSDLFDRVRTEAAEIIAKSDNQDEFSLVFFSDQAEQVTSLSSNKNIHRNALQKMLSISYRTTDFYKPLQLAEEILKDAVNPDKQIILISDFQNNGFNDQFDHWNIDPEITFIPLKIAPEKSVNSYISKFNLKQSRINSKNAAEFSAEIVSHNPNSNEDNTISLWINDKLLNQEDLKTQQLNQAFFQQFDINNGLNQGLIKTDNDNLNIDNSHFFTFSVKDLPSILCVDSDFENTGSDAFFLKSAFDIGDESLYTFSAGGMNYINESRFGGFDLIFAANLTTVSNRRFNVLSDFVFNGGSLILSFGEKIKIDNYSTLLSNFGIGQINNKDMIRNPVNQNGIITQVDFKHPIFSVFFESGAHEIFQPKFRRFAQITPDSNAVVSGKYDSGDPFLIESKFGKGKIFVYSSTFNTSWTNFPINDIYIPFLYQLADYALSLRDERTSCLVSETIQLPGNPGENWQIQTPEGKMLKVIVDETGVARFRQTEIPGNYVAQTKNNIFNFSVNVDIRESDLQTRNVDEVQSVIAQPDENRRKELAAALVGDRKDDEKRQKFWFYLVLLIVSLFVFETYYANKIFIKKENKTADQ